MSQVNHITATSTVHGTHATSRTGPVGAWHQESLTVVADDGEPLAPAVPPAPPMRPPPKIAHLAPPPSRAELRASIPTGAELHARQIAAQFMRTGRLPHHGQALDRETATLHYLALRTIKVALRENDDNKRPRHHAMAQLLPLATPKNGSSPPMTPRMLSRRLRRTYAHDPTELEEMLAPIFKGEPLPEGLLDLIENSDDSDDGEELTELLADASDLLDIPKNRRHLLELADEAEHDLLDQNRHRILASLNTEPEAARTSDRKSFQDAYCELVHDERGFCGTFKKIVELFGTENLRSTLMTLKKSIGGDMDGLSAPPSHYSPEYFAALHSFVKSLSNLSQTEVVLDITTTIVQLMGRRGTPINEPSLLKHISDLFQPGTPTALRFQSLCEQLDLAHGEQRTIMLNELGSIIRTLPSSAFEQTDTNGDVIRAGAAQQALLLDAMIAAQEEEHAYDPEYFMLSPHEQKLLDRTVGAPAVRAH